MPILRTDLDTVRAEFEYCQLRAVEERQVANEADGAARETHHVLAERYADRAWNLAEEYDLREAPNDRGSVGRIIQAQTLS